MEPTQPHRLDSLTGLRFFAAWMVLVHHFSNFAALPFLSRYQGFGATGVTFFFVLSGFVLTWSFVPADTPPRFYWRRFARVWPMHAVTTLLALPVFYGLRHQPWDWTAITLSLLLLQAWVASPATYFAGNPAAWSLSCEMFFYAVHPFVIRHVMALRVAALGVASALVVVVMFATVKWSPEVMSDQVVGWLLYVSPLFRIGEFVLGMALAAAMKRGFRVPIGLIPAAVLLAGWFHLKYQYGPQHFSAKGETFISQATYVALPVLFALLIAAAAQLDLRESASVLRTKPMVVLGQWSYALYLIHATVIYAAIEWIGVRPYGYINVLWLLGVTATCVAASAALYSAVERPIERRLRSLQKEWLARRAELPAEPVPAGAPGGG